MSRKIPRKILVAGVGNIFLGDDGFGPEVAKRLGAMDLPGWVRVADYGISGMHLAYDLADGYDAAILVDAAPRGDKPGTVTVLDATAERRPDAGPAGEAIGASRLFDAHGMQPDVVLGVLDMLGGAAPARIDGGPASRRFHAAAGARSAGGPPGPSGPDGGPGGGLIDWSHRLRDFRTIRRAKPATGWRRPATECGPELRPNQSGSKR